MHYQSIQKFNVFERVVYDILAKSILMCAIEVDPAKTNQNGLYVCTLYILSYIIIWKLFICYCCCPTSVKCRSRDELS